MKNKKWENINSDTLKKIGKYIVDVITYSCLIILILIGIMLIAYVVDNRIQASKGGTRKPLFNAYVVISGSMEPKIHVYDVIISKRVESKNLKKGDTITFYSNDSRLSGAVVTHRIDEVIDSKKGIFRTKGDANNVSDEALTTDENIIGKVAFRIPQLGRIQFFVASTGGWLVVVMFPCLAIISYDIVKIVKLSGKKIKRKKSVR